VLSIIKISIKVKTVCIKNPVRLISYRIFLCPYIFALVFGLSALAFQRLAPNALRLKVYLKPKQNLQALKV